MDPKRYVLLIIGLIIISLFSCRAVVVMPSMQVFYNKCIRDVLPRIELHSVDPAKDVNYINFLVNALCVNNSQEFGIFGWYNSNCTFGSPCYSKYQSVFRSFLNQIENNGVYEILTTDEENHVFYRNESPCRDPKTQYWVIRNNLSMKQCFNKEKCEKMKTDSPPLYCVNGCINLGPHEYDLYKDPDTEYKC